MRSWLVASSAVLLAAAARGEVKVMDTDDVVKLVSGEEIRGNVLGSGLKAVVIVVKGEDDRPTEKTIPREQVESITRGGSSPVMKDYATETVEGVRVVSGEAEGGEEDTGAAEPKAPAKGKKAGKGGGRAGGGKAGGGRARGGQAVPELSPQQIDSLMRNPLVQPYIKAAGGRDKVLERLKSGNIDPQTAKLLQRLLKSGKLLPGLTGDMPKK